MARTDAIVLGAGIVGTSIALHLAKRGLAVAMVDRGGVGRETSYGNAGILEGNTIFPPAFPADLGTLVQVALKRSAAANYHLAFLPKVVPWLMAYRAASSLRRLTETAHVIRPIFSRAVAEHEALMRDAGAEHYLRRTGWLKVYRRPESFAALRPEFDLAQEFGMTLDQLDVDAARGLEPSLNPVFHRAVHWPGAASISDPLGVTTAYAARFAALGGLTLRGDARSLHRNGGNWRIETNEGPVDARDAVIALGPWAPDVLEPLGIRLPLAVKRGYHRHYRPAGNAALSRPVLDADVGYVMTPMDQGIRITSGAEFAARDAAPTPAQLERLMPAAKALFPLGAPVAAEPWLGSRPCFPDSRPVIDRAPGHSGLWLAYGHGHWGLTLGAATGRLIAEMMTGTEPFCDPAPYSAARFRS